MTVESKMAYNEKLLKKLLPVARFVEGFRVRKKVKILKDVNIVKPIFIVGVPRSGTTILYRILCRHPQSGWFSDLDLQDWMTNERKRYVTNYYTKLKQQKNKIPVSEETVLVFGAKQRPIEGTSRVPIEAATFWQTFLDYAGKNISENRKDKIKTVIYKKLEIQDKPRFVNKSLYLNTRLTDLKEIFPDAKFINVVRDPRAVISSAIVRYKKEGYFDFGASLKIQSELSNEDLIQQLSLAYREIFDSINEFSYQEMNKNLMTVKYEEFCLNPKEVIFKILQFCELEIPTSIEEIIPKIREVSKKWEKNLTKSDQKNIFDILKMSLKKTDLNYKF